METTLLITQVKIFGDYPFFKFSKSTGAMKQIGKAFSIFQKKRNSHCFNNTVDCWILFFVILPTKYCGTEY